MDLAVAINKIKPIVESFQRQYENVVNDDNALYYNHAFEILGMLGIGELQIDKLPNPKPDMVRFNAQMTHAVPVAKQLFEYVISDKNSYDVAHQLWGQLSNQFSILQQLSLGTQLMLIKLLVPRFRQILVKRSPSAIPVLYAPSLSSLFQDLQAINDPNMIVELWLENKFQKVDGKTLFALLVQESVTKTTDLKQLNHLQTMDDLSLQKRFVIPTQMTDSSQQTGTHVFDAILAKTPGAKESQLIKAR